MRFWNLDISERQRRKIKLATLGHFRNAELNIYLEELPLRLLPDDELRDPDERLRDRELRELPLLDREFL